MNVLHICSYYIGNKLYKNLIKELGNHNINQHVFIPIKDEKYKGENQLIGRDNFITYYYADIIKRWHKFFYLSKIKKQFNEVEDLVLDKQEINFIHAHTVFSDGGTAYYLNKKYSIPYVVNVRNTDINTFFKYAIHLRRFMYKVLENSNGIVFLSVAYKNSLFSMLPRHVVKEISHKTYVIPNGIDDFWHHQSIKTKNKVQDTKINLIYIGQLNDNKNTKSIIKVCAKLNEMGYDFSLKIIGKGPMELNLKKLAKSLNLESKIDFYGYIKELESIKNLLLESDIFVMPSIKETFGLVYIEAMSMGVPVIYTRGQGIDGLFSEGKVGYSVLPNDINMISTKILEIYQNINIYSRNCIELSKEFNWITVSEKYLDLYKY